MVVEIALKGGYAAEGELSWRHKISKDSQHSRLCQHMRATTKKVEL